MLIRLIHPPTTPNELASQFVQGGLLFHRPPRSPNRVVGVTAYKRSVPDRPYRRKPVFRRRTPGRPARRTIRPSRAPKLTLWQPTWKNLFGRGELPQPPRRSTRVIHPGHRRFTRWASRVVSSRHRYRGVPWSRRPRQQTDPWLFLWGWHYRGNGSSLIGRRSPVSRTHTLTYRLRGLLRRQRHYQQVRLVTQKAKSYLTGYFHKRRRKFSLAEKRYHLFRRRRLRSRYRRGTTLKGYLRGTTRLSFYHTQVNRLARLEQTQLLGDSTQQYHTRLSQWMTHNWGSRVSTPLEYNYYRPYHGYYRFEKKRRADARRWKLGQHPRYAEQHYEGRQIRWNWFATTTIATTPVPVLSAPPQRSGLTSSLYWSTQRWGRGRWERPTGRAAHVFVTALKTGHTVEVDATQWGAAATSAAGVLHSHAVENDLRGDPAPTVVEPAPVDDEVEPAPVDDEVEPILVALEEILPWRYWGWVVVGWLWWVISPVWWAYYVVATGWCYFFWFLHATLHLVRGCGQAFSTGVYTFFYEQLWFPMWRGATHWVKERPFVKTGAWLWTSWLLAYTTDNEQPELDTPSYEDDAATLQSEEEFDNVDNYTEDYDAMDPGVRDSGSLGDRLFLPQWYRDVTSFVDDWEESLTDWITEEIPHQAGLFVRPLVDAVVRLPLWSVLEGVSLLALWWKLEWHYRWHCLLTRGNPTTGGKVYGRWWKVPLVLSVLLLRVLLVVVTAWVIFCQVDYSAFRVGLTYSWGVPWREEYYAAWFLMSGVTAVYLVGPASWKAYLFQELGLDSLVGTFIGAAQLSEEEDYYRSRPAGRLEQFLNKPYLFRPMPTEEAYRAESLNWTSGRSVSMYDETRLRLAQHYGPQNYGYDAMEDLDGLWFLFPFHQPLSDEGVWYPLDREHSITNRAARDPFAMRSNYYRDWDNTLVYPTSLPYRRPIPRQLRTMFPDES